MFDDDAKTAAAELNLTLTTRDRNKPPEQRTPMCGVPYHSSEAYISRLIAKGYKVAICEQTEDPAQAKGLVDREVIRVVTPGTLIEENMLEEGKNNFLAALYSGPQGAGLCLGDISTGEVFLTQFDPAGWQEHAINELARFSPREIILSPGACEEGLLDYLSAKLSCRVEHASEARFDLAAAQARVTQQFTVGLDQVPGDARPAIQAAGGLLSYLYETQKTDLSYLHTVRYYSTGRFLELDPVARRNLELTETLRGKEKKGSLLWVLDKTKTAMGGRQLRSWLERPLLDPVAISRRLDAVGWLVDHSVEREELTQVLREITDLERLISRIVYGTAGARDLVALAAGLRRLPELQNYLPDKSPVLLARLREQQVYDAFLRGAGDLLGVAFIIALSRGITVVMNDGSITDTILYWGEKALSGAHPMIFILMVFGLYLGLSFLIPSSSGLATLSVPVLAPLGAFAGVAGSLIITAFQAASGLINLVTPTSAVVMGALALGEVTYPQWLRFAAGYLLLALGHAGLGHADASREATAQLEAVDPWNERLAYLPMLGVL